MRNAGDNNDDNDRVDAAAMEEKGMEETKAVTCDMVHHGAAASSTSHSLLWLLDDSNSGETDTYTDGDRYDDDDDRQNNHMVYASHGIINVASLVRPQQLELSSSVIPNVHTTLRTSSVAAAPTRVVTSLSQVVPHTTIRMQDTSNDDDAAYDAAASATTSLPTAMIATSFSDGTLNVWSRSNSHAVTSPSEDGTLWRETIVCEASTSTATSTPAAAATVSITDTSGVCLNVQQNDPLLLLATASCTGVTLFTCPLHSNNHTTTNNNNTSNSATQRHEVTRNMAAATVSLQVYPTNHTNTSGQVVDVLLLVGTAAPRHNRIHVYTIRVDQRASNSSTTTTMNHRPVLSIQPHGGLLGHQDWITCLAWKKSNGTSANSNANSNSNKNVLASGSKDAKIRLWNFIPSMMTTTTNPVEHNIQTNVDGLASQFSDGMVLEENDEDDEDSVKEEDLLEEEGEARLQIFHPTSHSNDNDNDTDDAASSSSSAVTNVTLEALLIGHEEPVTSVHWHPTLEHCLMSASMDRTILLWTPESTTSSSGDGEEEDTSGGGVWAPLTRVGSAGGIIGGSIGSSLLGFVDALFDPTGRRIVGHGYGGSLHFWSLLNNISDTVGNVETANAPNDEVVVALNLLEEDSMHNFRATPCLTGHFRSVTDIAWEATRGSYLMSVSADQTCRLWTCLPIDSSNKNNKNNNKGRTDKMVWMEVARPQVHGYDLNAITCIGDGRKELLHRFVSGADEKEVRAFDAPRSTVRLLTSLQSSSSSHGHGEETTTTPMVVDDQDETRVERAYIPSLGLSNRATAGEDDGDMEEEQDVDEEDESNTYKQGDDRLPVLPLERDLGVTTLWLETRKLFGHKTELVCLTSTITAKCGILLESYPNAPILVASSCKARDVDNASIRLWNVEESICTQVLKGGHRSTVAALAFSSDGKYLASSGKDRRLCIWRREDKSPVESPTFELACGLDSAHKRIVWTLSFCPLHPTILASGARDGLVKIWQVVESSTSTTTDEDEVLQSNTNQLHSFQPALEGDQKGAVTAVAFAPVTLSNHESTTEEGILAVGLESGHIRIWSIPFDSSQKCRLLHALAPSECHFATVKKLCWKPIATKPEEVRSMDHCQLTLASCGVDHGVRIFNFEIGG
eukprot:scaffold3561_cov55-Attheya_sp.AAC.1